MKGILSLSLNCLATLLFLGECNQHRVGFLAEKWLKILFECAFRSNHSSDAHFRTVAVATKRRVCTQNRTLKFLQSTRIPHRRVYLMEISGEDQWRIRRSTKHRPYFPIHMRVPRHLSEPSRHLLAISTKLWPKILEFHHPIKDSLAFWRPHHLSWMEKGNTIWYK